MNQYLGDQADSPDGKVYYKLGESISHFIYIPIDLRSSANLDDRIKNPDQLSISSLPFLSSVFMGGSQDDHARHPTVFYPSGGYLF